MTATTLEEKQKEIDALKEEFDEYIASSREMEGELEEEVAKIAEEKSDAESRAILLAGQLAKCQLQTSSLERQLTTVTKELASENQRRVVAETRTEEAENKMREAEGSLEMLRSREVKKLEQELEVSLERIAFVECEADDCRNELNAEKQRYREEIRALRTDVEVLRGKLMEKGILRSDGWEGECQLLDSGEAVSSESTVEILEVPGSEETGGTDAYDGAEKDCNGGGVLDAPSSSPEVPEVTDSTTNKQRNQPVRSEAKPKQETVNGELLVTEEAEVLSYKVAELEATTEQLRGENAVLREQLQQTPTESCCTIS